LDKDFKRRELPKIIMMKKVFYSFALAAIMISCTTAKKAALVNNQSGFDFEAHRGGRGLMPENTIPAMKNAVDLGVTTLEMDAVISKDNKVVVSHDPFFNEAITTTPEGKYLTKKEAEEHLIYGMTYDEIRRYDVGIKPHPGFPQQKKINTYKPLLSELIDSVEAYAKSKGKTMRYNIEIKSKESTDGIRHPEPKAFSELFLAVLRDKKILDRTIVQSFDVRPLQYIHKTYPAIKLSYLVENTTAPLQEQLDKLGFVPEVYSPNSSLVTKEVVSQAHQKGMKVIPWTVNTVEDMNAIIAMGVDGIISDYPNLFTQLEIKR
jgi:glycerophosphoryl diester phosphodiesterase